MQCPHSREWTCFTQNMEEKDTEKKQVNAIIFRLRPEAPLDSSRIIHLSTFSAHVLHQKQKKKCVQRWKCDRVHEGHKHPTSTTSLENKFHEQLPSSLTICTINIHQYIDQGKNTYMNNKKDTQWRNMNINSWWPNAWDVEHYMKKQQISPPNVPIRCLISNYSKIIRVQLNCTCNFTPFWKANAQQVLFFQLNSFHF